MRLLLACTVHASLRGALLRTPDAAAGAPGVDFEEPRGTFVPKCQAMVHVKFEDYLPLGAITKVCEGAGNHAGCHAWGAELTALFRKQAEPGEYASWCGEFYDWFHERFADRCTSQCEQYACKPICAYADASAALAEEGAELDAQKQAVAASQQQLAALTRDKEAAAAAEVAAAEAETNSFNAIGKANLRRDAALRAYDEAAAKVATVEQEVVTASTALEAAESLEADADATSTAMRHAVDKAKLDKSIAMKAVQRGEKAVAAAAQKASASWQKLSALKKQSARDSAAYEAKVKAVAAAEKKHATQRASLEKRMKDAKAANQAKKAALAAQKKKVTQFSKTFDKKKAMPDSLSKLGAVAEAKKKLAVATSQKKVLTTEAGVLQRKVDDLMVALRLLKDAEDKNAKKKAPLPFAEQKLAKLEQQVFAAEGAQGAAKTANEAAEHDAKTAEAAVEAAAAGVASATDEAAAALAALGKAAKATATAAATQRGVQDRLTQVQWTLLDPAEAGLETTGKEVSAAKGALEAATADHAEAKGDLAAAKEAAAAEQEALDAILAKLSAAKEDLQKRKAALGAPPPVLLLGLRLR